MRQSQVVLRLPQRVMRAAQRVRKRSLEPHRPPCLAHDRAVTLNERVFHLAQGEPTVPRQLPTVRVRVQLIGHL